MRRFDLFVRPKNRRPVEEEVPKPPPAAVPIVSVEYNAEVYFLTGKKVIEALMRNNPNGNYVGEDAENFTMALRSLRVAAEKFQEECRWNDAELAWQLIEGASEDQTIKQDASVQKAYCHQRLISPMPPR